MITKSYKVFDETTKMYHRAGFKQSKKNPKVWIIEGNLKLHILLLINTSGYWKKVNIDAAKEKLSNMRIIEEILELHEDSRSYSIAINEFYYTLNDQNKLVRI
jgi:hypothetical protein